MKIRLSGVLLLAACSGSSPLNGEADGGVRADAAGGAGGAGGLAGEAGVAPAVSQLPDTIDGVGHGLVKLPSGVVAVGTATRKDSMTGSDLLAVKFDESGRVDPTFGNVMGAQVQAVPAGTFGTSTVPANEDLLWDAVADGDKVVAVGLSQGPLATPAGSVTVVRFNANGSLDTTFSGDGLHTERYGTNNTTLAQYSAIVRMPDGRFIVGGHVDNGGVVLARFNPDGTRDTGFDTAPKAFGPESAPVVYGLVLQGAKAVFGGGKNFIMGRALDTGVTDMTFGTAGVVRSNGGVMLKLLGRPDGKLLAVGQTTLGPLNMERNAVKLFQASGDGAVDSTFGTNGVVEFVPPSPVTSLGSIRGVQLLPDGALLVYALGIANGVQGSSFLFKITQAGAFDAAFGVRSVGINVPNALFGLPAPANRLLVVGNAAWVVDRDEVEIRRGTKKIFFKVSKTIF